MAVAVPALPSWHPKMSAMSTPTSALAATAAPEASKTSNFLRQIIEHDLDKGTYASRRWAGSPGDAAHHAAAEKAQGMGEVLASL